MEENTNEIIITPREITEKIEKDLQNPSYEIYTPPKLIIGNGEVLQMHKSIAELENFIHENNDLLSKNNLYLYVVSPRSNTPSPNIPHIHRLTQREDLCEEDSIENTSSDSHENDDSIDPVSPHDLIVQLQDDNIMNNNCIIDDNEDKDDNCKEEKEEESNNRSEKSEDENSLMSCAICFEQKSLKTIHFLHNCTHFYCKECLGDFIKTRVEDGQVLGICCPDPSCKRLFLPSDIEELVEEESVLRFDQLKALAELNSNPNCRWCPKVGCNTAMICDPSLSIVSCTQCDTKICFSCKSFWHEGETCEEYKLHCEKVDEELLVWNKWASENNAKQCPQCGVWIIRSSGCNQVSCKSCQYSFCWLCLKHCIVPDHYQGGECDGKWFEDAEPTTAMKVAGGIFIVVASPIILLAGGVYLGRKLKKKLSKKRKPKKLKNLKMEDFMDFSHLDNLGDDNNSNNDINNLTANTTFNTDFVVQKNEEEIKLRDSKPKKKEKTKGKRDSKRKIS